VKRINSYLYADDVKLLENNINTINIYPETFIDSRKEISIKINIDKTKYMLCCHHQNAGQNLDIKKQTV
jgi:hypothetical protein